MKIIDLAKLWYACKFGIGGGEARCRNQEGHCPAHPATKQCALAPRPEVVLVKFNIGKPESRWSDVFVKDDGVPVEFRTWGERRELEVQRAIAAERWGRNPYSQRKGSGANRPEGADTGVKVWGQNGLYQMHVGAVPLVAELKAAGFILTWVSVLRRDQMEDVLVTAWTQSAWIGKNGLDLPEVKPAPSFDRFIATSFDVCHVYANPADASKDGVVEHTVNFARRQGEAAWYNIQFATGDWSVAPAKVAAQLPVAESVAQ